MRKLTPDPRLAGSAPLPPTISQRRPMFFRSALKPAPEDAAVDCAIGKYLPRLLSIAVTFR